VEHAGVWGYIPLDHCSQNAPLSSTWGTQRKRGFNHRKAFSEKYCKGLCAHEREKKKRRKENWFHSSSFFFFHSGTIIVILTAVIMVIAGKSWWFISCICHMHY